MASATVSKTASASKSAELRALLNPPTVKAAPAAVKAAPAVVAEPIKTPSATVKTVTVDGFTLTLFAGDVPDSLIKASATRSTSNPWYAVMVWLAGCKPGYVEIQRNDDSVKSPMSKIDGAIARCRKAGIAHYGKLDARSGATKGTWYLIRRA